MGLRVHVYRNMGSDCSNNGISYVHDTLTVINCEGPFDPTEYAPAVRLVPGPMGDPIIVPAAHWQGHRMFGGNFAYTSDSRFRDAAAEIAGNRTATAIPIHDRFER